MFAVSWFQFDILHKWTVDTHLFNVHMKSLEMNSTQIFYRATSTLLLSSTLDPAHQA